MVNMTYYKVEIHELSWFNHLFIIFSPFLIVALKATIRSINDEKAKSKSTKIANKRNQWYIKIDSNVKIC